MDRRTSFRVYGLCLFLLTLVAPWAQADGDAVWMTYFQSRDAEAALAAFQEAVIESPTDALAWAGLSLLGESRAAIEEVSGTYFDALQHGADQPQARVFLEWALQGVTGKDSAAHAVERLDAVLGQENVPLELRDALWFAKGGLLKRLGRWDEASAMYEQLGFVREFWLCGPFDNAEKSGHGRVFGPEESIALDESYPGKRGAVQWRPMPLLPYNGYIDLHPLITPSKEVSTYLATRLDSEAGRAAVLKIGHSGAVKAWLNGDLVADVDRYHALGLDQVNVPLTLGAGKNYLLLKVSSNQEGRYGVFVRVVDESQQPLAAAMLDPKTDEVSGLVPKPDAVFDDKRATEPSGFLQMKALAEGEGAKPYHFLFYSLLLDVLDLADETDPTANKILSELNTLIPNHPLILRFLGDTEKEANRKRLAYTQALEVDAKDQACFLRLLRYYRDAPYATVFLDLVRGWERGSEVPFGARLMQAQFLSKRGLNDAAIDLLRGLEGDPVAIQRLMYEFGKSAFSEEAMTQRAKDILAEDAGDLDRVHDLRRLALRAGDRAEVERLLEWEQRIAPLSISGLVDVARNEQGRGAYEASLPYIERALAVAPDDFECHRLAAIAHEALGDRERALNELAFCMKVQPSDPWCRDYAKFLQPEEENYATPYLREWQGIKVPETLDLSQANYVTLLDQRIVKVFQNGNSSETVHTASLILTDTGLRQKQVDGVYYDADTEEVRVIRARVWKQDGTFYDAPRPQKRSAASAQDAAQKLYGDYSVAVIEFPALEKGAVVELEYEKKSKGENIYADYFGDIFYAGDTALQPTVVADYVLITPTSRDFYWKMLPPHYPASVSQEGVVLQTEPEVKESGPERVYHWVFRHMPAIPQEPFMPKATEILPYIKVSTFKTWNDMTTWYWNLMKDQIVPGQPLKERLRQVLADYRKKRGYGEGQELSQWELVRAINEYVNTGVRYLGLEFGIHGYKPHKVDEICNARYGDCKDKAALAITMLKEVGIEAHFVILRTSQLGEIDYELPMIGMFNHAIYYLPDVGGQEYWIDGTATFFDATELPSSDEGVNSLIVKPGGEYEFKRIPYSAAESNGGVYTTVLTVDANGNATGYRASEFRGLYNPVIRRSYENTVKAKEIVDRTLVGTYPGSRTWNLELSDITDYSTAESLSYELELLPYGVRRGQELLLPSVVFDESLSQRFAHLSQREFDLILGAGWNRTNVLKLTLPEGHGEVQLPPDQTIETEYGRYTRQSVVKDGVVEIKEDVLFLANRVPKEKYAAFREFCRLVDMRQDEKITVKMQG